MKRFLTALTLSVAVLSAPAAMAETPAPNATEQAEARATLQTATAVINYGRAKGDALALVTGVEMMLAVAEGTTIEEKGQAMDLGKILDEAAELGKDDPMIVAKVDSLRDAAETKTRGACYWEYWCDWYGYCEYWYVCY